MVGRHEFAQMSVLVIDNNAHMMSIFKTILKGLGVGKAFEASDAPKAFETLRNESIDLAIVEHRLETLTGIEFVQMVRNAKDSSNPYVPIIMATDHAERRRVEEARDAGVTEFLLKPISATALSDRIISAIGQPRPFVRANQYAGPDRRRHDPHGFSGEDRRRDGEPRTRQSTPAARN